MAISLLSNLMINMKQPTTVRDQFSTLEDMKAFREEYLPDMYDSFCLETGLKYRFNRSNPIDEITGKWRVIGEGGSADLESYYTKTQTNTLLNDKVDKEIGKGLSTNDYDDTEKGQVATNTSAIETLNGNSSVIGSVDNKVANGLQDSKDYTDTQLETKVDKIVGKGLSTNDFTAEYKAKLDDLENYDDTALANRISANENAITILNGDNTVNGSVDNKVANCLTDSKSYTDTQIQNAVQQRGIACDSKPIKSGSNITYVKDGQSYTIKSDNKTKFYYTSNGINYSTIWIEDTEFTDTIASVDFTDYVSKTNDLVSTYTGSEADKTKVPTLASLDALKSLVDNDLTDKVNISDIESTVSQSSDNPVKSSTLYSKFAEKVDISQGVLNEGKILQVNDEGNLALVEPESTIDLSDYVSKTNDVTDEYTGSEVDKTKVTTIASLDDLKSMIDTSLDGKVSISQGVLNEGKILQVNDEGNLALVDVSNMGNEASEVSYTNSDFSTLDNVKKALDNLFSKVYYIEPKINSFTMTPSTTTYEIGSTVSELAFTWAYNKDIVSQSLTGCTLADETTRSATYSTAITSNKTFTLTASDGEKTVTSSKSISFQNKIYWGSASIPQDYNSAFILGLSNNKFATSYKGSYTITVGNGEYGFICCPKSWNIPSVCKIGGFSTELIKENSISFTNSSGGVRVYDIIRTNHSGLGEITMVFE